MSSRSLFDPVIDGGIRNPNWFEGRLLTADALRAKDQAERARERLLGRALGAGIFEGLFVTRAAADTSGIYKTLNITKGAAINGGGDTLLLSQDVTVDVVPPTAPVQVPSTLFARCQPPPLATVPSGFGIYVLVMSPSSAYRERAPKSGLGNEGVVTGCGDAFVVDGVAFRLEKLEPANISGIDAAARDELTALIGASAADATRSLLRNVVAHYCFDTRQLALDPFAKPTATSDPMPGGAIDDLRKLKRIGSCDVPIALLLWRTEGVSFVDCWAVRRRPAGGAGTAGPLPADRRPAPSGTARALQFQTHLAELITQTSLPQILKCRDYFRYLPAAGILEISAPEARGLSATTFFQDLTVRYPRPPRFNPNAGPEFMEGSRLQTLLHLSHDYPPIDARTQQAIWLYRVRENGMLLDAGTDPNVVPLVIFASGQMPYVGSPRFDVAHWNYANYSSAASGPGGL